MMIQDMNKCHNECKHRKDIKGICKKDWYISISNTFVCFDYESETNDR